MLSFFLLLLTHPDIDLDLAYCPIHAFLEVLLLQLLAFMTLVLLFQGVGLIGAFLSCFDLGFLPTHLPSWMWKQQ